jgi:16S rRNA (guanine966-N2)-methyltransferase
LTPFIDGATCLDLFAGSGSLGFEAISRGAQACQFIDQSKTNIEQINLNIKSLQLTNCTTEISESYKYVTRIMTKDMTSFSLIPHTNLIAMIG